MSILSLALVVWIVVSYLDGQAERRDAARRQADHEHRYGPF